MGRTSIEWATHTVNWLAGCIKVSPACQHCYAETMTARLATMPQAPARYRDGVVEDRRWTGRISYDSAALRAAFDGLRDAQHPRRVLVNSMSDTFHADAPESSLVDLAAHIRQHDVLHAAHDRVHGDHMPYDRADLVNAGLIRCSRHTLILLTKRPDRLLAWQREHFPAGLPAWVWVGCTVEDQRRANERIPLLLQVGATVRLLSCEPLLGPVDLSTWVGEMAWPSHRLIGCDEWTVVGEEDACRGCPSGGPVCAGVWDRGLQWVIAGGESGSRARPSHPDWFRSLRDQCAAAKVPFHFKQWGEWAPLNDGPGGDVDLARHGASPRAAGFFDYQGRWNGPDVPAGQRLGELSIEPRMRANPFRQTMGLVGKHAAGRLLDGVTHDGLPEVSNG